MRMSIKRRIRHGKDVPFSLDRGQFRVNAPNMIYSAAVFNRRYLPLLIGVIAFAASGSALGQPATSSSASAAGTSSVAAPAVTVGQSAPPSAQADASPAGVVTLEQRGKVIGLGFVLAGDGRIVTALSSLGDGNQIVARFGSGNSVEVKVGHTARAWNIALLVPQSGGTEAGMSASSADPFGAGTRVRGFTRRGKSVAPMPVVLKGKTEMIGGDGEVLKEAFEITTPISLSELGAPLVDVEGRVIGVVSSACKSSDVRSAANCRTVA
ncbi:MAG: serine protease, partial [Polyangiaceae bacterium]|nr:serine protease [Polyangiaceae bacterium]